MVTLLNEQSEIDNLRRDLNDQEQQLAERIIAAVGGMDNIDSVMNCMTRVRIKVLDENKVDDQELRHIDGVMGVIHDERIQVVVGPGTVNKVANHMAELSGVKLGDPIPHHHNDSEKWTINHMQLIKQRRIRKRIKQNKRMVS